MYQFFVIVAGTIIEVPTIQESVVLRMRLNRSGTPFTGIALENLPDKSVAIFGAGAEFEVA